MVDEFGAYLQIAYCAADCPLHPNAWTSDDTLRVTYNYNQKEIMTAWKLYGIMSSSLLLISLMVTGLGTRKLLNIYMKIVNFL